MTPYDPFHFESLVWNWPIAVYLFLVGVSAGMVIVAISVKRLTPSLQTMPIHTLQFNAIFKSMAIIAPLTVISGLVILIFHLSKPWAFWKIMVFYSPVSVMSLGVILFQVYMLFLFVWLAMIFKLPLLALLQALFKKRLRWIPTLFDRVIHYLTPFNSFFETMSLLCALLLGAYTGFLLSALKSYPLLNNPILPILFMFSGISSGAAACILASVTCFKESTHSTNISVIHKIELPVVLMEVFLLFAFFMGSYFGGGQKVVAVINAIGGGFWAGVFWYGVIGIGIVLPLGLGALLSDRIKHTKLYVIFVTSCALLGIFMLRHFILYAGQMTIV